MIFSRKMPAFQSVQQGATNTVAVPRGPTYRQFVLYCTDGGVAGTAAKMIADISYIRIKVNGITRWECSGADAITLAKYYGATIADNGRLPIVLTRKDWKTLPAMENLAWGTADVDTLHFEVDLKSGGDIDGLALYAHVTAEERVLGTIVEVHKSNLTAAATGLFELSNVPRFNGDLVGMHFDHSGAAVVTELEVFLNQVQVFNHDLTLWHADLTDFGRVPQTTWVHFETTILDRIDDRQPLGRAIQDMRFNLTFTTAGQVPYLMETINLPLALAPV